MMYVVLARRGDPIWAVLLLLPYCTIPRTKQALASSFLQGFREQLDESRNTTAVLLEPTLTFSLPSPTHTHTHKPSHTRSPLTCRRPSLDSFDKLSCVPFKRWCGRALLPLPPRPATCWCFQSTEHSCTEQQWQLQVEEECMATNACIIKLLMFRGNC